MSTPVTLLVLAFLVLLATIPLRRRYGDAPFAVAGGAYVLIAVLAMLGIVA